MIGDMEAELTEASEINSKTDNLEVTEEANVDEAIPIYPEKELQTKACNKKTKIDIENINTLSYQE